MHGPTGIHHVTAIAGSAQQNLDFWAGVMGMRLVKRSVNQDDPHTYHLFYADAAGSPGTDLTFFPWEDHGPARPGHGLSVEVGLAVPPDTLAWWGDRLVRYGASPGGTGTRFGERVLTFADPHGLPVALVEREDDGGFAAWAEGPVPAERQVRGLHGVRLQARERAPGAAFLDEVLGFTRLGAEEGWDRHILPGGGPGAFVDLIETPEARRGVWGVGAIHHVAWRVHDETALGAVRGRLEAARRRPSAVIDRRWFRSVYVLEPGGALFEFATEGPGFAVDEAPGALGTALVLPPWLEPSRDAIVGALPSLAPPDPSRLPGAGG